MNPQIVKFSRNDYDWLGTGFYIWENNYDRALHWAQEFKENPAVIGVVYELGNCLDLMDSNCINCIKRANIELKKIYAVVGKILPNNKDLPKDENKDKILRKRDCAVINYVTSETDRRYLENIKSHGFSDVFPYDTVRGCFKEGSRLDNMEIYEKTHIQISIRNLDCIKGFFMPREHIDFPAQE